MSLRHCDELCEAAPSWTDEEKAKIRAYRPPDRVTHTVWDGYRGEQATAEARRRRNEWIRQWQEDLSRMRFMHGG
jgi:hypothetical protein